MKAIPMLFQTFLVKALLEGRKTVTRRPLKNQPQDSGLGYMWIASNKHQSMIQINNIENVDCEHKKQYLKDLISECCPYGSVGDLIYVRETFRLFSNADECGCYDHCSCPPNGTPLYFSTHYDSERKWKPSIHMPRKHSRLTLKVTDVRIERVQDITESQAKSEGIAPSFTSEFGKCPVVPNYRDGFFHTWNNIYNNWDQNPYVWVIEFEVIHKNVDQVISEMKGAA